VDVLTTLAQAEPEPVTKIVLENVLVWHGSGVETKGKEKPSAVDVITLDHRKAEKLAWHQMRSFSLPPETYRYRGCVNSGPQCALLASYSGLRRKKTKTATRKGSKQRPAAVQPRHFRFWDGHAFTIELVKG
jgi:hypothetical protein